MSRLPIPGSDDGQWGQLLNDFLQNAHATDGSLKDVGVLAGKEPAFSSGSTSQYLRGDKTWQAIDKTIVGLANVDNTADSAKPISSATQTALNAKRSKVDTYNNVHDYGATGNGTTDDTAAIQTALAALPQGQILYFPAGTYLISAPLTLKRNQSIQGTHAARWAYDGGSPSVIKASGSFAGASLIYIPDMELLGASEETDGGRILTIALDGSTIGSAVDGIKFEGQCRDWKIMDVSITDVTGSGIRTIGYTRLGGYVHCKGFALHRVAVNKAHNNGYSFNDTTDSIFFDCLAVGCFSNGFFITGAGENQYFCCRAVFNGAHGFQYTGTHTGSVFSACTTDRNDKYGFHITATGAYPVVLYGLVTRRDGRNGNAGGGAYAGLNIAGTSLGNLASPVWINGLIQTTGVDDDNTGVNSPQYGIKTAFCRFIYIDGLPWGDTAAFNDAGGNSIIRFSPNTYSTIGLPASPTRDTTTKEQDYEGSSSTATVLTSQVTADAFKRFVMGAGGKLNWGPGTATQDTNLYRPGVGLLQTDQRFKATDGLTTKTNAGAVTDAVFANAPADGTLAVDTTNTALYMRSAGSWSSIGAANVAPQTIVFRSSSSESWTNQPAAVTEFLGGTTRRLKLELNNVGQARLQVSLTTAGNAGATVSIQYSTDASTWNYLDGVSGPTCAISTTGLTVSSWVTIVAGAKSDVFLRIVGAGGNAATTPVFVTVALQIKP